MHNKLILVQWTNNFGGLEKITQMIEERFAGYNPLIVPLRQFQNGLKYKSEFLLRNKDKFFFTYEYIMFVRKRRNAIFHIQYAGTTILLLTYLAGARKIIFHFHGTMLPNFNKYIWKLLEKKIIVIANSIHTKNVIRKKLDAEADINVIPNLIDIQQFNYSRRTYREGKFIITFAGRFDKGKNIGLILETATLLKNKTHQLEFRLIGDGPEKENIEKRIQEYALQSMVKLFPYTNDIIKAYHESNLFLFVSLYESFGNVVAEAVLTGLPVLCYRIPSLEEFIIDDLFFIEKAEAEVVAERIIQFKENYEMVNDRLLKVSGEVRKYLDNENILKRLESIYRELSIK